MEEIKRLTLLFPKPALSKASTRDRQTNRQTDRQTDRQTRLFIYIDKRKVNYLDNYDGIYVGLDPQ